MEPKGEVVGEATGLLSGEGRVVACRDLNRIFFVMLSMLMDSAPGKDKSSNVSLRSCWYKLHVVVCRMAAGLERL